MRSNATLHLYICGAGPAKRIHELIRLAKDGGWDVYCVATESAVQHFLDIDEIAALSEHPVRTTYRHPGDRSAPNADAIIVAPATYNTINKWAAGIADNYVLTQLAELTGRKIRIIVLPFVNQALAANLAFTRSIDYLRKSGVRVLFGQGEFEPHPPGTGDTAMNSYPWKLALDVASDPGTSENA